MRRFETKYYYTKKYLTFVCIWTRFILHYNKTDIYFIIFCMPGIPASQPFSTCYHFCTVFSQQIRLLAFKL